MKADNLPIAKVFSSGGDIHYVLPHFQREYTWEKENWQTLLDDALAVYDEIESGEAGEDGFGDVEHFLGSIVVIHDGIRAGTVGAFKLVDGQQRLTTVSLLLKALAKCIENAQPALTKKIEKLLVNADEVGDLFYKILPTVKYGDRAAYCAILKGGSVSPNQSKIPTAFQFFETELTTRLSDGLNPEKFLQVIISAFQVVFVNLDQKESPYRIFESLNAKGKPLTQADLVRNYVAMKLPAARQERVFTESWSRVEELLQETRTVGRLTELTAFLRHYLAMRTGVLCDEKHVYARFRDRAEKEFAETGAFEKELETIARFAAHYDKLLRPEKFENKSIVRALTRLNSLEVSTGYPFLLKASEALSNGQLSAVQFNQALETLENYMVRRYLVGEPQSYLNRMFPILWNETRLDDLAGSLKQSLARRNYPTNTKVLRAVETRRLYDKSEHNRRRTSLVLESINRKLSEGSGGYTVLDSAPTIEHIMPQTLSDLWKREIGIMWEQVYRDHVHTLGNLTLVTAEWNSELSNAPFSTKQKKLATNALRLNCSYFTDETTKWGRDEILERAEELADVILKIWPSFLTSDESAEPKLGSNEKVMASEFHFEAVERVAQKLATPLRKLSQARYESKDGQQRVVGLCSKTYKLPSGVLRYWYGLRPSQKVFLEKPGTSWLAFECGGSSKIVLISYAVFLQFIKSLNETPGQHWHVDLFDEGGRIELNLPLIAQRADVTTHLLG